MNKICILTTVSATMTSFVLDTAKYLYEHEGYDITLICNDNEEFRKLLPDCIHYMPVHMSRGIDVSGLFSILQFIRIFQKGKFDLIQYATPNAACYASIASWFVRAPIRLYCQWGIRYTGLSGIQRKIFKTIEKMVCTLSTHIRAVSPMNREFAIGEGLYKANKVKIVGNGGTIGVDRMYYDIAHKQQWRHKIRSQYQLSEDDFVFGFAGRVSGDKGCTELLTAFQQIAERQNKVKLLIVGPIEDHCGVDQRLIEWTRNSEQVVSVGLVENKMMREYYATMDVLVHPTYREGFGMVIQEAGSLAVPVITTKIPGASEVMVEGVSCLLAEPKNVTSLFECMEKMLYNSGMREAYGEAARRRVEENFDRAIMLENQRLDYCSLLK